MLERIREVAYDSALKKFVLRKEGSGKRIEVPIGGVQTGFLTAGQPASGETVHPSFAPLLIPLGYLPDANGSLSGVTFDSGKIVLPPGYYTGWVQSTFLDSAHPGGFREIRWDLQNWDRNFAVGSERKVGPSEVATSTQVACPIAMWLPGEDKLALRALQNNPDSADIVCQASLQLVHVSIS